MSMPKSAGSGDRIPCKSYIYQFSALSFLQRVIFFRCLLDTDDEVRDRATFYVNILKEKEKALSSGYILNGGYWTQTANTN